MNTEELTAAFQQAQTVSEIIDIWNTHCTELLDYVRLYDNPVDCFEDTAESKTFISWFQKDKTDEIWDYLKSVSDNSIIAVLNYCDSQNPRMFSNLNKFRKCVISLIQEYRS